MKEEFSDIPFLEWQTGGRFNIAEHLIALSKRIVNDYKSEDANSQAHVDFRYNGIDAVPPVKSFGLNLTPRNFYALTTFNKHSTDSNGKMQFQGGRSKAYPQRPDLENYFHGASAEQLLEIKKLEGKIKTPVPTDRPNEYDYGYYCISVRRMDSENDIVNIGVAVKVCMDIKKEDWAIVLHELDLGGRSAVDISPDELMEIVLDSFSSLSDKVFNPKKEDCDIVRLPKLNIEKILKGAKRKDKVHKFFTGKSRSPAKMTDDIMNPLMDYLGEVFGGAEEGGEEQDGGEQLDTKTKRRLPRFGDIINKFKKQKSDDEAGNQNHKT
jgi:hypothetical protein